MTNREAYFKAKDTVKSTRGRKISDNEIYLLLMNANKFASFQETIKSFDEELINKDKFNRNLVRAMEGEPIQYILNSAPFLDFDLYVTPDVLIPRPETEELASIVHTLILKRELAHDVIGDVCTGSGCLALYLKLHFPFSKVYGSDKYENVLDIARHNNDKYKLNVEFLIGSKLEPFIEKDIKLDVLISNPPYVEKKSDIEEIVKNYEPMKAIYVEDGLYFYRSFFKHHKEVMKEKYLMAFEINYDQEEALSLLIKEYFIGENIEFAFIKDIFNQTRFLIIIGGVENAFSFEN